MLQIQCVLHLWGQLVPQLDGEVFVCGCECSNKCIFVCLDCAFGCVYLVVMRLNKLQFTLLFCEEFFDVLGGLVAHDIYLGLEAFGCKYIELFCLSFKDAYIVHSRDRSDQNGIQFVMVQYKKSQASIKRHEGECTGKIIVHYSTGLVCKCAKTKNVCNCYIVIFASY
jgi:hypothetical protein